MKRNDQSYKVISIYEMFDEQIFNSICQQPGISDSCYLKLLTNIYELFPFCYILFLFCCCSEHVWSQKHIFGDVKIIAFCLIDRTVVHSSIENLNCNYSVESIIEIQYYSSLGIDLKPNHPAFKTVMCVENILVVFPQWNGRKVITELAFYAKGKQHLL